MGWAPLPADASLDGNTAAPVVAPAPDAAPATPASDQFAPLPADATLDNSPATVVAAPTETAGTFRDQEPAQAHEMPKEMQGQLVNILSTHPIDTAASDARTFLASHGYYPAPSHDPKYADEFDEVIDYRKQHHAVSSDVQTLLSKPGAEVPTGTGAAAVRGAGDGLTAGLLTHVDSALHAASDAVTGAPGSNDGFVDDFHRWEDINQGILRSDEANHPHARLVGQLLGGLAIPTGLEGVGLEAGKSVLTAGGTMREARAAAAAAVRNRVAVEGGAYGGVHGAATAPPGQEVQGAVEGAGLGAAASYGLAAAGQAVPKVGEALGSIKSSVMDALGIAPEAAAAAPEAAPDYVQIARDLNIRRTPSTNSGTGTTTVMQAGLGALPGGTPIGKGAEQEAADLVNAGRSVAEGVGQVSDRQGAGEAIAHGAQQYKATSKDAAKELYNKRDELIGGSDTPVPTNETKSALDDISARFPTSPAIQQLREHPAIRAIGGALPGEPTSVEVPTGILDANGNPLTRTVTSGGEPLTLGEVTEALSHVRGVVRNLTDQSLSGKATAPVLARVQQVKQGLQNDVMNAATRADVAAGREPGAEDSALKAQRDADAFYADRSQALNGALKKPLQSAADDTKMSGESVYNQVLGDTNAKSGNLARLRDTWFRLPPQAKSTFAATAIDDMFHATPGQQNATNTAGSFQTFLTNLSKWSPQARNIVFGAKVDGDLQKIATYADRLRQLDRARNFSNTAQKYFAGAFMATVGGAVMHGDLGHAAEAAMALPATWGGAKLLLATPRMRDWTAQAMKAMALQGNARETALKVLTKKLGSIAVTDPSIASEASGLQSTILRAANDNLHALAASGGDKQPDSQRKQASGSR